MRFLLFDRVTALAPGPRVAAVKCVGLTEECLRGHFERRPLFPASLVVEAMLQLVGWCAIQHHGFAVSAVLSVLEDVRVRPDLGPGTRLDLTGELAGTNPRGSVGRAWAEAEGVRVASLGRVILAHLPYPDPEAMRRRFETLGIVAPAAAAAGEGP